MIIACRFVGILLIVLSIYQLIYLSDFAYYQRSFSLATNFSLEIINMRYKVSILLRVMTIVLGIGIFFRNNFARRCAIWLGYSLILSAFFRHVQRGWEFRYFHTVLSIASGYFLIRFFSNTTIK